MDRIVAMFTGEADGDLTICQQAGIAWQTDMTVRAAYDQGYFNKCLSYEDKDIALAINRGRIDLVDDYVHGGIVLDVGIGSGEFIKKREGLTYGTDVNPVAIAWLKNRGRHVETFEGFTAFTFWDVIEHLPEPDVYFRRMPQGAYLFTSIPVFDDLSRIRESKHYRPGEHLYYFTSGGFIAWMSFHGFVFLEVRDFETVAGRDSILSFAFRKVKDWVN